MRRTVLSAVVAVVTTALVLPAAQAAPPGSSGQGDQDATALLRGELVLLADAHRGEHPGTATTPHDDADSQLAYLDVAGTAVPLDPASLAGAGAGSVVTVEVPVPAAVTTAVAQGEPVPVTAAAGADGPADEAVVPRAALAAALAAAQDRPAPAGSHLAAATAVAAADTATPLTASVVAVAPAQVSPASRAPHEVTVAVVGVNGKTDARYTDAEVSRLVDETSRFWSDQTGGAVTFRLAGAATRWSSSTSCSNAMALWDEAEARTGFQPGPDRHLVLMVPRAAYDAGSCSYGLGSVGSGVSDGGVSYVADTKWSVLAHELGHNMSLQHANRLACSTARADAAQSSSGALSGGCSEAAYGDLADVMSASAADATGGLGAVGLRRLGLLETGAQQSVTATGVTSVTLAPLGSSAGLRVAGVTDPRNANTYYLENRQAVGRDVFGFAGAGMRSATNPGGTPAGLRVLKQGAGGSSVLLDPTPTACSSCRQDDDVVVAPGTTFRSAADGVEIRTRQLADGSMVADVSVAAAGQAHWAGTPTPAPTPTPTPAPTPTPTPAPSAATVVTVAPVKARSTSTTALPVTVTTAANRAPVPGGTVTASAGGTRLAGASVSRGRATLVLPAMARGRYDLVVAYEPPGSGSGAALKGSSVPAMLDVAGASSRVSAALAPRSVTVAGIPSVLVAVAAPGATPTGTVTVTENGAALGSAELVRGRATVALPAQTLGRHALVVTYGGDTRVDGGRSAPTTLTVTPLPVSAVAATVSRASAGQQAALTATVRAVGRPATGRVSVVRDGQAVADAQLVGGRALLRLPALPAGRHALTVVHAGSPGVTGGTRAVTVVVAAAR